MQVVEKLKKFFTHCFNLFILIFVVHIIITRVYYYFYFFNKEQKFILFYLSYFIVKETRETRNVNLSTL